MKKKQKMKSWKGKQIFLIDCKGDCNMKKIYIVLSMALIMCVSITGCSIKSPKLCKVKECKNEHVENAEYCDNHICMNDGCDALKIGARYCEEHFACDLCANERCEDSSYCLAHKCAICNDKCLNGTRACAKHKCMIADCGNATILKYCNDEHRCLASGCEELRIENEKYCSLHLAENKQKLAEIEKKEKEQQEKKQQKEKEQQKQYQNTIDNFKDKVVVDSNGKKIWKVYMIDNVFRFKANFRGEGNFIVTLLDDNQDYYASICNEIGDYVVDKKIPVKQDKYYYVETFCSDGEWSGTFFGTYGE